MDGCASLTSCWLCARTGQGCLGTLLSEAGRCGRTLFYPETSLYTLSYCLLMSDLCQARAEIWLDLPSVVGASAKVFEVAISNCGLIKQPLIALLDDGFRTRIWQVYVPRAILLELIQPRLFALVRNICMWLRLCFLASHTFVPIACKQQTVAFQLSPTKTPQDILDFELFSSPNITDITYIYTLAIFHTVYMPLQLLSSCKVLKYESFSTLESSFFQGIKSQDEVL